MKTLLFLALATAALSTSAAAAPDAPTVVRLDHETTVADIKVGCSGIGQSKADPRWLAYPNRLEFANPKREYLADVVVSISRGKEALATVACEGPWVLIDAPAGTYTVSAWLREGGEPRGATIAGGPHPQRRVVITFPDAQ